MLIVVTIAILAITLAVVAVAYSRTILRSRQIEKENALLKNKMHERAGNLLAEAHKHSLHIIEDANERAQELLSSTHEYVAHSDDTLSQKLKDMTEEQKKQIASHADSLTQMYQNLLENLKRDNINTFRNVSKDIAIDSKAELDAFTEAVKKETVATQKELETRIEDAYKKAQREIDEYKKTELADFDDRVIKVAQDAAEEVLGKSLTLSEQEELITKTLAEAKETLTAHH